MKKIGPWLALISIFFNQLTWPLVVFAQEVEPSLTPTEVVEQVEDTPAETVEGPESTPTPDETLEETPAEATPTITPTATPTEGVGETEVGIQDETVENGLEVTPTITPADLPTEGVGETEVELAEEATESASSIDPVSFLVVVNTSSQETQNNIEIDNKADVNQDGGAEANSGENIVVATGEDDQSTIVTGDVVALGNVVNMANVTNLDSSIKVFMLNNVSGEVGQVDLNSDWNLLNQAFNNVSILTVDTTGDFNKLNINNSGEIQNQISVYANSGGNVITGGGNNTILTGNAYALANLFNILNLNLINSQLYIGVINVDGATLGDLILPNPSNFMSAGSLGGAYSIEVSSNADIGNNLLSTADSGGNEISTGEGDASIASGDAMSTSMSMTTTNISLFGSQQMTVGVNVLGQWGGAICNWGTPGSENVGGESNMFSTGLPGDPEEGEVAYDFENDAIINNQVETGAFSGNNSIDSENGKQSTIVTGNAWSMANIINMANLNLINSRWFYGIINIIGNWNGNVVFAYPDMTMAMNIEKNELKIGEETDIAVDYSNIGYDESAGSQLVLNLPGDIEYLGDNSGIIPTRSGNSLVWQLGKVEANTGHGFLVRVRLVEHKIGFRFVKPAFAAEASSMSEVIINGAISTSKTEVSTSNNNASAVVHVRIDGSEIVEQSNTFDDGNDGGVSNLWPKLSLSEKNNVNGWVYEKDTVTFEIVGKNDGEAAAYNTYLIHIITDESGNILSKNRINIGNVGIGREGKVNFGIPIQSFFSTNEKLFSQTMWIGYTDKNEEVESNISQSSFMVKSTAIEKANVVSEVNAVDTEPQVLGQTISVVNNIDLLPYLLLFLLSSFWILKQTKKWIKK